MAAPTYDLLSALSSNYREGYRAKIFGRVSAVLQRPKSLAKGITFQGELAELEVFAIRISSPELEFSSTGKNEEAFFSQGTMGIVLRDAARWVDKFVEVGDRNNYPVRVKWQDGLYTPHGVSAFSFTKQEYDWVIVPNVITNLASNPFTEPDLRKYWDLSVRQDKIVQPPEVAANASYTAVRDKIVIPTQVQESPVGMVSGESVTATAPSVAVDEDPWAITVTEGESLDPVWGTPVYESPTPKPVPTAGSPKQTQYETKKVEVRGDTILGEATKPVEESHSDKRKVNGLYHTLEPVKTSQYLSTVQEVIDDARKDLQTMISNWKQSISTEESDYEEADQIIEDIISMFSERAIYKYGEKIGAHRGNYFLEKLVDWIIGQRDSESNDKRTSDDLVFEITSKAPSPFWEVLPSGLGERRIVGAAAALSIILGTSAEELLDAIIYLSKIENIPTRLAFLSILKNPHVVATLLDSFSFETADKILFFSQSRWAIVSLDGAATWADTGMVLHNLKSSNNHSTRLPSSRLRTTYDSYRLINNAQQTNTPFSNYQLTNVKSFLGGEQFSTYSSFGYSFDKRQMLSRSRDGRNILKLAENAGLVIHYEFDDTYELTSYVYKELEIYRILQEKALEGTGVTQEAIDQAISQYESEKGFKLEKLQKDGIQLLKQAAGVLSGSAGSGKTTVSEVMVLALQNSLPEYEILFAAPTGKAARRLSEVVGSGVKTLHSLFKLGIGGSSSVLLSEGEEDIRAVQDQKKCYIFDEMAMSNTDLLYQVVTRLPEDSLVYFLGDIKQLPPIGKGIPFKDLMDFLPVVELGVSKRAAKNSGINYNCNVLNSGTNQPLESRPDFHITSCKDSEINNQVIAAVRNAMQKYPTEEIQVISPYQTKRKPHSSTNLNPRLKDIMTPGPDIFEYRNTRFVKGERVIHTNSNRYNRRRYVVNPGSDENWLDLTEVETTGVVNGEMGKIIGFIDSNNVSITPLDRPEPTDGSPALKLRDDSKTKRGTWFILFETYDVDLGHDVILLYHVRKSQSEDFGYPEFYGGDFGDIELAYALTVHKMQGSQAKCVILPLASDDNPRFVTRNMIYTAISRASEEVYLLGSVEGTASALSESRKISTGTEARSAFSFLIAEK